MRLWVFKGSILILRRVLFVLLRLRMILIGCCCICRVLLVRLSVDVLLWRIMVLFGSGGVFIIGLLSFGLVFLRRLVLRILWCMIFGICLC